MKKKLELIQVIKATTIASPDGDGSTHTYFYEHHDLNGSRRLSHINCGSIDRVFAPMRMKDGKNFAVRRSGQSRFTLIDENTYLQYRLQYNNG